MERIVVISCNNNPDYSFYVPITTWAWQRLGWKVALFYTHEVDIRTLPMPCQPDYLCAIPQIEGVRTGTQAQVARHFSANMLPKDAYILLSDIDMIPLSDYIKPDYDKRTIWGWDLTGYGFVPVSYIGMTGDKWFDLMGLTYGMKADMEKAMKENGRAYKDKWEDYWDADWDILTQRVLPRKKEFTCIDRGKVTIWNNTATARGRVERWYIRELMQQPELIDCHAENNNPSAPEKWDAVRTVMIKGLGEIPAWMDGYVINHHNKYGQGR